MRIVTVIAVGLWAVNLGLRHARFRRLTEMYRARAHSEFLAAHHLTYRIHAFGPSLGEVGAIRSHERLLSYNTMLSEKYARASRRPWRPISPAPPAPPRNPQLLTSDRPWGRVSRLPDIP